MRIICLFLLVSFASRVQAQASSEDFLNDAFFKFTDSAYSRYYLIAGSDTCRFEKFDYDEWVKYHLRESVPLTTLNELAYKVHIARKPYYWKVNKLKKATCITVKEADSLLIHYPAAKQMVLSLSQPQFTDDGEYAVVDINWKWDLIRGGGYTYLFRRTPDGWRNIGSKRNWGNDQ